MKRSFFTVIITLLILPSVTFSQSTDTLRKEKSFTFGLTGSVPTGPWVNRASAGLGVLVKYEVRVSRKVAWFLHGGYNHFWGKTSTFGNAKYITSYEHGEFGSGVEFFTSNNFYWLAGATVNTFGARNVVEENFSGWIQSTRTNHQREKFGLLAGMGYLYPLTTSLDLEGTATYHYMGDEGSNLRLILGVKVKFY
ncbi:MAG: hypothetical protein IFNCLDLE_02596 [Ignavibacteriaceae bacterium]|nr:hypothetical protein [Ignavibacteriaceae bacterium]